MTAARSTSSKPGRSIPVKVNLDRRPTPTKLPPLNLDQPTPAPAAPKSVPRTVAKPIKALQQPVHEWPEAKRRRLMWWLVAGGAMVIIIGWLAVMRWEMSGGHPENLFADAWKLIRSVDFSRSNNTNGAEQEIRNLDSQVFPQFQQ